MTVTLPIQLRSKDKSFTNNDVIAGVVYGPKYSSQSVAIDRKDFEKTFKMAGESTVIELQGLDKPVEVLIKDVEFSPLKGRITHVDFYVLEKGKEVETHVPITFINEAPAAKLGAVVNKVMHEFNVVCKPADLPNHIDVDLALLVNVEDKIHVSDIKVPKGVKITNDTNDIVAVAEEVKEEIAEESTITEAEVLAEPKTE
jgi:large subunit ribosomal protein L25